MQPPEHVYTLEKDEGARIRLRSRRFLADLLEGTCQFPTAAKRMNEIRSRSAFRAKPFRFRCQLDRKTPGKDGAVRAAPNGHLPGPDPDHQANAQSIGANRSPQTCASH